jgi:hypothetical protein
MPGTEEGESSFQEGSMFEEMKDQILAKDSNTIGIVVALLVGLITLVLLFIWTRRKSLGRG